MTEIAESPVLEIKRLFDAAPASVFKTWLNREEWQSWIGPEGVDCEVPLLEPRVGGRYRIIMHLPDGSVIPVVGVFKTIEAPKRLAFTWGRDGDARTTLVTVTLRDLGGKTEMILRHEGLPTDADRAGHGKGWNSALNKLVSYLAKAGREG
jgi:uncharacterized protein YndB with AHSA1/START domain